MKKERKKMRENHRPVRIPEGIEIGRSEPPVARAGERGTWRFFFTLSRNIPEDRHLVLFLSGGRNNKGSWLKPEDDDSPLEEFMILERQGRDRLRLADQRRSYAHDFLAFEVPEGGLQAGETLVATLGKPAGAITQSLSLPDKFVLLMEWVPGQEAAPPNTIFGDVLSKIVGACVIDIVGGTLDHLRAYAPSSVKPGEEFSILIRPEDAYGNVSSGTPGEIVLKLGKRELHATISEVEGSACRVAEGIQLEEEGVHRISVSETATSLSTTTNPILCSRALTERLYWGYIHGHTEFSDGTGSIEHYFRYMRDECKLDFSAPGDHDHLWETSEEMWRLTCEAVARYNEPHRFTTFLGYEWAKWRKNGDGDRNVYYLEDHRPLYRSDNECYPTPSHLFEALEDETAIVIPHHTAGNGNHCDWKDHEPEKERLVEIYSFWGNSERSYRDGNLFPIRPVGATPSERIDAGEVPEGFVQRALALGWRVGFCGGGDDHIAHAGDEVRVGAQPWRYKSGLMALYADANTRDALWKAMYERRAYATTGARIIVRFSLSGFPMGKEVSLSESPSLRSSRRLAVCVHGTAPIKSIEIVRNNTDIHRVRPEEMDSSFEWEDSEALDEINLPPTKFTSVPFTFYYLRVTQYDGETAWTSPIWILSK